MFVLAVLSDMGVNVDELMPAITDSKSGMDVITQPGVTKHTAHFERWLHWARRLHSIKIIQMYLAPTDKMMADDKTKVTDRDKFLKCRAFQLNDTKR